jgi:hypothetical protein
MNVKTALFNVRFYFERLIYGTMLLGRSVPVSWWYTYTTPCGPQYESFLFLWRYSPNLDLGLPSWNSPFHFGLLDLRYSVGFLGRWSVDRKASTCTQTQKNAHTHTNIKHPCPEWDSNSRSQLPSVHALDRSVTVTGIWIITIAKVPNLVPFGLVDRLELNMVLWRHDAILHLQGAIFVNLNIKHSEGTNFWG